jgi:NADPH-dependent glutamate synthase beta subunit-like oxidoreductase
MPLPGGMLVYGVPNYRLKNDVALAEIKAIEHLGAKIYCNTKVGRDVSLTELYDKYDSVFIGNGLWKSREIPVPGTDQPDVIRGIEYLKVLTAGKSFPIGKHLVVIGGGNVAFDVGRSSVRNGADKVTMVCMESRDEQTADEFEIEDGVEEGIQIINRVGPVEILRDSHGKISGVKVRRLYSLFDHERKFAPKFVEGSDFVIECDTVALAVGQQMDLSLFDGWDRKEDLALERGVIKTARYWSHLCTGHILWWRRGLRSCFVYYCYPPWARSCTSNRS